MPSWTTLWLVFVQGTLFVNLCKGAIECVCNLPECRRDHKKTCQAENMCYVQYMPANSNSKAHVTRGCIDNNTPLLCENRRPQSHDGLWPVLHCCKINMCNQHVLPTIPPWLQQLEGKKNKTSQGVKRDQHRSHTVSYEHNVNQKGSQFSRNASLSRTINPLYLGVPLAGACVLLAIIIFAIYILKRQSLYREECRYHGNLPQHHRHHVHHFHHHNHHIPTNEIKDPQDFNKMSKENRYSECDRSSSGSETKLLMKV